MQVINTIQPGCPNETIPILGRVLHDFNTPVSHVQLVYTKEFKEVLIMNNEIQSSGLDQEFYHVKLVSAAIRGWERDIIIFGGGEGCTARQVLDTAPFANIRQYDYDLQAMAWASVALQHWNKGVYDDPRLKVTIADADNVVLGTEMADAVIIDLFDYRPEDEAFMTRIICKGASALRIGGRLSAYLGDDTLQLREYISRLQTQLEEFCKVGYSFVNISSYGGANSMFLKIEKLL